MSGEDRVEVERLRAEVEKLRGDRIVSVVFGHHKGAPRPFALYRKPPRVLVALGAEFPDGAIALRLANDGGWTTRSDGGAEAFAAADGLELVWLSSELADLVGEELESEDRGYRRAVQALREAAKRHNEEGNSTLWATYSVGADFLDCLADAAPRNEGAQTNG